LLIIFLFVTGFKRQVQGIARNIEEKLKKTGFAPSRIEGYQEGKLDTHGLWRMLSFISFKNQLGIL